MGKLWDIVSTFGSAFSSDTTVLDEKDREELLIDSGLMPQNLEDSTENDSKETSIDNEKMQEISNENTLKEELKVNVQTERPVGKSKKEENKKDSKEDREI